MTLVSRRMDNARLPNRSLKPDVERWGPARARNQVPVHGRGSEQGWCRRESALWGRRLLGNSRSRGAIRRVFGGDGTTRSFIGRTSDTTTSKKRHHSQTKRSSKSNRLTKLFTAASAMILVEQGRLKLSDELSTYVPSFAKTRVYAGRKKTVPMKTAITIHQLLTHTSGLFYWFYGMTAGLPRDLAAQFECRE